MTTKTLEKILLMIFLISTVFSVVYLANSVIEIGNSKEWIVFAFLAFPVILMVLHSFIVLSLKRGLIFILIAMVTGTMMEYFGLKYGVVFGGEYVYNMSFLKLFTVPLPVIFFWPVFIYTSYCLINSYLVWFKKDKPSRLNGNWLLLIFLVICDSLAVTAIDLFMDPLQVIGGNWSWIGGGAYYGIPIGNFIGWFIVAFISAGLFRTFEYFFPKEKRDVSKIIYLIPVLGYGMLSIFFTITAVRFAMISLAVFGFITMTAPVLASIYIYLRTNKLKINSIK